MISCLSTRASFVTELSIFMQDVVMDSTSAAIRTLDTALARWLELLADSPGRAPLPGLDRATLLLVDLQCLFVEPSSPAYLRDWAAARYRCAALLEAFRRAGRPVVWTLHRNPLGDDGGVIGHFGGRPLRETDPLCALHGDWAPAPHEPVLRKARYSPWVDTDLEALVAPGTPLVIAGVTTHRCVLAAGVEAASRDRLPVVVADACATRGDALQVAALRLLAGGFAHVATTQEVIDAI